MGEVSKENLMTLSRFTTRVCGERKTLKEVVKNLFKVSRGKTRDPAFLRG